MSSNRTTAIVCAVLGCLFLAGYRVRSGGSSSCRAGVATGRESPTCKVQAATAAGNSAAAATLPPPAAPAMRAFGPVIRQPALGRHTGSVILLHGLGDTGDGWAPVGPQLRLPHIKFIYPTAPTRPITVNMGMRMPGWFDITHLDQSGLLDMMKGKPFDPEGVAESVAHVRSLIQEEVAAGIPLNRIVVGGFSQGGHIAYKAVLQHEPPLAGCIALSTWLEPSLKNVSPSNLELPIFVGHGSADNLIPPVIATTTQQVLEGLGCTNVEFHMYTGMGHSSCPQELQDVRSWLLRVLPDLPLSKEEVQGMSAKQLKAFLQSKGVNTTGMLEKKEMVDAALALL